jgi:hypothetical protein
VRISGSAEDGFSLQDTAMNRQKDVVIRAGTLWSVFSPVDQHDIEIMENESYIAAEPASIERMRLGTDFVIFGEEAGEVEPEQDNQLPDNEEWFINPK